MRTPQEHADALRRDALVLETLGVTYRTDAIAQVDSFRWAATLIEVVERLAAGIRLEALTTSTWTCDEADVLADVLRAAGDHTGASGLLADHADADPECPGHFDTDNDRCRFCGGSHFDYGDES